MTRPLWTSVLALSRKRLLAIVLLVCGAVVAVVAANVFGALFILDGDHRAYSRWSMRYGSSNQALLVTLAASAAVLLVFVPLSIALARHCVRSLRPEWE